VRANPRQISLSALGLAVFMALIFWGGSDVLKSLMSSHLGYITIFLVVGFFQTLLAAWRWAITLDWFVGHNHTSFKTYYRSFVLSRVSGLFIPQVVSDLAVRPVLHGLSRSSSHIDAFAGSITEKLLDVSLALSMSIPAILFIVNLVDSSWFVVLLFSVVTIWSIVMVAFGPFVLRWAGKVILNAMYIFTRVTRSRFGSITESVAQSVDRITRASEDKTTMTKLVALTVVRYVLIGVYLVLLAYALPLSDMGLIEVLSALPIAQLGAVMAITPGGIGFVEGGFFGAFVLTGVSAQSAVTYLIALRLLVSLNILLHGAITLMTHKQRGDSPKCENSLL